MKQLYKNIRLLTVILLTASVVQGQDKNEHSWEIGAGIGYTNYYGDVSNYRLHNIRDAYKVFRFAEFNNRYVNRPSFSLLAQRKLNNTVGIMLQANSVQFSMSDRYRRRNGDVDMEAMNYNRALNFRTNLQDIGFAVTFNSNNGRVFKEDAVFYPSFYVGLGVSAFSVKGDLYDENGAPYNYNTPGYINDGDYETDLRDLNTEEGDKYSNVAPYLNLGLALNFRLTSFLSLALQSDIKYSGSDYLDDVSKTYKPAYSDPAAGYAARPGNNIVDPVTLQRGDNNGVNDVYINNRLAIFYTLHPKRKKQSFKAPVVYAISRADTSLIAMRMTRRDTTRPVQQKSTYKMADPRKQRADSLAGLDSIARRLKLSDSLALARQRTDTAFQSSVDDRLSSIQTELQNIKTVMRNQGLLPRYRYLQYQNDSVARLSARVNAKRTITQSDRLQQRVYALQQDSIRYEMQKVMWMTQYPAKDFDSTLLNFDPMKELESGKWPRTYYDTMIIDSAVSIDEPLVTDSLVVVNSYKSKLSQLKAGNRYQSDIGYRSRIDSLENRFNNYDRDIFLASPNTSTEDSLRSTYDARFNAMQKRLDSLEKVEQRLINSVRVDTVRIESRAGQRADDSLRTTARRPVSDTSRSSAIRPRDTTTSRMARTEDRIIDTAVTNASESARQGIRETVNEESDADLTDAIQVQDSLNRAIERNSGELTRMQSQLNASRDSAAYFRRTLYARDLDEADTVVEKKKWYQRILPSGNKQRTAEAENAEAAQLRQQADFYDAQTRNMNRDIEQLQRANRTLEYNYDQLRRRQNDRVINRTPPVLIQGGANNSNSRELNELRSEINQLRAQLVVAPALARRDTVVMQAQAAPVAVAPVVDRDSAQLIAMQSDLQALQKEIDSMRNVPKPVKAPEPVYDVSSFPVISVYFAMNASTLPPTQSDKISPMVAAAKKNKKAKIVLKGFTDPVGNVTINKALAIKRTDYVKGLLVSKYDLPAEQIITEEPEVPDVKGVKRANPLDRRVDLQFQ